ncbi:MAG: LON peptidase substrate-binding domain-containing protein [Anaerolineae bacterium]|nr:LON peptidase substrate-binding domain-containing protein [Anaerolineae bacterium]
MFELPLFPLHTVLFPGTPIYLHIFERRYREMVTHCLETDRRFGVVLIRQGSEAGGGAIPYPIGCVARIIHLEPLPDNHLNLVAIGEQRFVIKNLLFDRPYLCGEVEFLTLEEQPPEAWSEEVKKLSHQVTKYLEMLNKVRTANLDLSRVHLPKDPVALTYLSASFLQIPATEKQPLLSSQNITELIKNTQRLYRREVAVNQRLLDISEPEAIRISHLN